MKQISRWMSWIGLALICELVLPTEIKAELLYLSTTASVFVWFDTFQRNSIVNSTPVDHLKCVRCTPITNSILEELEWAVNKTDAALKSFDDMRLDWRLSEIVGKKIGEQMSQQLGFDRKFYGCAPASSYYDSQICKSWRSSGSQRWRWTWCFLVCAFCWTGSHSPSPKSPLVGAIDKLLVQNKEEHDSTAKEWTTKYALTKL